MTPIVLNFNQLKTASKFLAYNLLLVLPLTLETTVLAQRAIPPKPSISQTANSEADIIIKKLVGEWKNKNASGADVNFLFTADGKMFLMMVVSDQAVAYPLKYHVDATQNPMYMDIKLPDNPKPVLTIFDFIADGEMRMQIEGTNPGQPRPKNFSQDVSVFKQVSNSATLPENFQIIDPDDANKSQPESLQMITLMNRSQQAYFLANGKFAKTIEDLQIGIKSESEDYVYRIIPQGKGNQSIVHTATAKKPDLKSYTGIVFTIKVKGKPSLDAAICETIKPTSKPPAIPKIPTKVSQPVKCPSGSILLP